MGNFCVAIGLKEVDQSRLAGALSGRSFNAIVGPRVGAWCFFSEEITDTQDQYAIEGLARDLSREFDTSCLSILNHDDDFLSLGLAVSGAFVASYHSCPGYFLDEPTDAELEPTVTGFSAFAELSPGADTSALRRVLFPEDDFVFAIDLHRTIAEILDLPIYSIGLSYSYAADGETPLSIEEFLRTPQPSQGNGT